MTLITSCVSYEHFLTSEFEDQINETNPGSNLIYEKLNQFYNDFDFIHTWLSLTLCCSGLIANIVTVAVLTRKNMASVVNRLLTAVAICDSCLLTFYLIFVLHYKFLTDCPASQFSYSWTVFALVHANLSIVLRASSLWLSVVVAGYRKTILYFNPSNMTESSWLAPVAVAVTIISVTLVATPIFLGNAIHEERSPQDNLCPNDTNVFYRVVPSDYSYSYDCFLLKINHFINAVLLKLLPLCFLTYYLVSIIKFFCRRSRFRRNSLNITENETNCFCIPSSCCSRSNSVHNIISPHPTTVILGAILLMTMLCEMPNAVASAFSSFLSSEFYWFVYRNLGDVFDVLSLFNGLTTFSMYCIMSGSFRETFAQLFRNKNSKRPSLKLESNLHKCDEASTLLKKTSTMTKQIKQLDRADVRCSRDSNLAPDNDPGNETADGVCDES